MDFGTAIAAGWWPIGFIVWLIWIQVRRIYWDIQQLPLDKLFVVSTVWPIYLFMILTTVVPQVAVELNCWAHRLVLTSKKQQFYEAIKVLIVDAGLPVRLTGYQETTVLKYRRFLIYVDDFEQLCVTLDVYTGHEACLSKKCFKFMVPISDPTFPQQLYQWFKNAGQGS